jgi:hypothetical protein
MPKGKGYGKGYGDKVDGSKLRTPFVKGDMKSGGGKSKMSGSKRY